MSGVSLANVRRPRMPQTRPALRPKAFVQGPPPATIARPITTAPLPIKPQYPKRPLTQGLQDTRFNRSVPRRLRKGDLVDGIVNNVVPYGVFVKLPHDHGGLVHISHVSHMKVDNLADIFRPGDRIKAVIVGEPTNPRKLALSTKRLETLPGQMLDDAQAVYASAADTVARYYAPPAALLEPFFLEGVPE